MYMFFVLMNSITPVDICGFVDLHSHVISLKIKGSHWRRSLKEMV